MDRVRVGIVGVGGMGTFHAHTLAALAGVEIVAVADPHGPNAAAVRDALGATIVDDPIALVEQAAIDALVIASPDPTHADLTIAAIARGLPTLCEKPLATTIADARRVVEAESAAGRRLVQVGFMREYDPAHRQLGEAMTEIGRVVALRTVHRNTPAPHRPIEVVVGQSIVHDVHTVRFLTGAEFTSVFASTASVDGRVRHIAVTGALSNGAHAVIEFDDAGFAYEVTVEVIGEHGDVVTGPPLRAVRRRRGSVEVPLGADWFGWFAEAYRRQDASWIESVRHGRATGPSVRDGLVAQTVVEAIVRSIRDGGSVTPEAVPPDVS